MYEYKKGIIVNLISKANTDTEKNTAEKEHEHIGGSCIDDGADEEGEAASKNGNFAAFIASNIGGTEASKEASNVEGGGKTSEQLRVKFTILVIIFAFLHPVIYCWKEVFQKYIH